MANPKHVEVVMQGREAIARWRETHPRETLELTGADLGVNLFTETLYGVDLRGANLELANLAGANLYESDLSGADLSGAVLVGAMLRGAGLRGTKLDRAKLVEADLENADLRGASLIGASLNRANLRDSDLTGVSLIGIDLDGADLRKCNLSDASLIGTSLNRADLRNSHLGWASLIETNLDGADLRNSGCSGTVFGGVDLSRVCGLEGVHHYGPSRIDVATLSRSKGRIPDVFLQGVGLSNWEIEAAKLYDPGLTANQISEIQYRIFDLRTGSPIQINSLFLSYTHADSRFVDALGLKFDEKGIRFWRDIHDAPAGPLDKIVDRAIRQNPTMLLVLSTNSVESDWVEDEADRACELAKELGRDMLCPVALDDAWKDCRWSRKLRTQIKKYNILPFHDWENPAAFDRMFHRLVEGLAIFYQPESADH